METRDSRPLEALGDVRPAPDPALTADDILKAAEDLVPLLRERAVAADRDRRIEPDTYRRLGDAGFFHILKPKKYGGLASLVVRVGSSSGVIRRLPVRQADGRVRVAGLALSVRAVRSGPVGPRGRQG